MKSLADISCTSLDILASLAALASAPALPVSRPAAGGGPIPPAAGSASTSSPPPTAKKTSETPPAGQTRPMTATELGPLDMEKYLNHFGVVFDVKEDGSKTLYRLEKCLFNPDHAPNEASIVVPRKGAFTYQCFHSSCKHHTWKEAKQLISGDRKLQQFCQGYDPNWQPPRTTGTGMMAALTVPMTDAAALKNGIGGGPPVPQPSDVDPREFYEKKGKRPVFVPFYLAKYLAAYLHPICSTNSTFYHYETGVWKEFTKTSIRQICVHAMREDIQAAWINNVTDILSGLVNREESEWPDNPLLINVKNGMLDTEKREILPHSPVYGSRTQLPVTFDPKMTFDRWIKFLEEIFPDDPDYSKRGLLQQYFGYCLLRDARYQKALFLYGTGANGKSTVLDVLTAMVGAENTASLTLQDLSKQFRAQFLQNKLVNLSTETDTRDPITTNVFKAVVDGSPLTTERKYGEPFQYRPYAKWIVAMNEAPVIPDKSYGFGRRVLVLNFNRRFEPEEIKDRMADYLIEEIDGIFSWSVEGLYMLLNSKGFRVGDLVTEDTDKLMEALNPLLIFIVECCEVRPDIHENTERIWNAYSAWCAIGRNRALGRNKFYEQITATFPTVKKSRYQNKKEEIDEVRFTGIHLTTQGRDYADKGERKSTKMFE